MTVQAEPSRSGTPRFVVGMATAVAVLTRLPFLDHASGKDEAGFLIVGSQWHSGGSSLYGNYWVDRPPLLITIFQAAAWLGGLVPLRLLGCIAVAAVVLGTAHLAGQIGGARASAWAAVFAAALCTSPLLGVQEVNGELLSAPFVVLGLGVLVVAIRSPLGPRTLVLSGLGGAATVVAVLVKQNVLDVGVFLVVALLIGTRTGLGRVRASRILLGFLGGALLALVVAAAWTVAHGTTVSGVFDAMYPFRLRAGRAMAREENPASVSRMLMLGVSWIACGGAIMMLLVGRATWTRRLVGPVEWALVAVLGYDVVSVALGGSYWHHYLILFVVPLAVLTGVMAARSVPGVRAVTVVAAVVAAAMWVYVLPTASHGTAGTATGHAIAKVARPGDTLITLWGHSDVNRGAGLPSPYPYLWSLPAHIQDPDAAILDRVLAGPEAPVWLVTWRPENFPRNLALSTVKLIDLRYRLVADLNGRSVFLLRGQDRQAPGSGRTS